MDASKIDIHNLLLIDVPHADSMDITDMSWKRPAFFGAEDCDRQLLLSSTGNEESVPEALRKQCIPAAEAKLFSDDMIIDRGAQAYRHLLKAAIGMLDKQLGEKKTIDEMKSNWSKFSDQHDNAAENKARFGSLMQAVFADTKAVRGQVFEDREGGNCLRPVSREPAVAARNMLDIKPVDQVLVIGEKEGLTLSTLKVLDTAFRKQNKGSYPDSGIVLTHPDPKEFEAMKRNVSALIKDKKFKGTVTFVPYEQAMQEIFPKANFVFNCQPQDNGKSDETLIAAAKARTNPTSMLVHLKGVPTERNHTSEAWQDSGCKRMVCIEGIKQQSERDNVHNDRMRDLAERAIQNCVASRLEGKQPVKKMLLVDNDEYAKFISNAQGRTRPNEKRTPLDHATRPPPERKKE